MKTKTETYLNKYKEYMVPTYEPEMIPVRGEGSRVWDIENNEYIDLGGGIAVLGLGHCHPDAVKTLKKQADKLWHVSNVFANIPSIKLAEKLCKATFAEKVFFANSGGESVEAALKLARKYAFDNFGSEKNEIISFHNAFHGRTLFTVTVGGQKKYREGFGPVPPAVTYAEFNNLDDLKEKISDRCCAVIMEPIQGEGGITPATQKFAAGVRELCDKHNTLLIFDEVQSGFGRTGSLYAYEQLGVTPDIMASAKALGAGFPIGAMLTTTKIAQSFSIGSHGSTYGGNPLATAVAETVFDLINTPEVLNGVQKKRKLFEERLNQINQKYDIFDPIRGLGLLIGCPLKGEWEGKAKDFLLAGQEEGIMLLVAGPSVIRLAPSLIISDNEINEAMDKFEKAVEKLVNS